MDFSGSLIDVQYWKENHSPKVLVGVFKEDTETVDEIANSIIWTLSHLVVSKKKTFYVKSQISTTFLACIAFAHETMTFTFFKFPKNLAKFAWVERVL